MSPVKGKDVVIEILDGSDWKLYACGVSCSLNITTDVIEISTKGSGTFADFLPTKNSFTGSIEGVVNLDAPGMLTLADLRKRQIQHTKFKMKYIRETVDGNTTYYDEAFFYITSSTDTGAVGDFNTFSIELRGTGSITGKLITLGDYLVDGSGNYLVDSFGNRLRHSTTLQLYP